MTKKNRLPLNDTQKALLQFSAGDLIPMLKEQPDQRHVRQMAFEHYDADTKQFWQVHVLVTRYQDDFLEPFQTEEMA